MPTNTPTDLPNLQSWISSSPPYQNVNHRSTAFIDVNDFTTHELEVALCYAIKIYEGERAELKTTLQEAEGQVNESILSHATQTLTWTSTGPMSQIPPGDFQQMAMSAKFADDLTYQNCVMGLAVGIKKIKEEIVNLRREEKGGDEDDWFLVRDGGDEKEMREQERLYAEIEIQLDCGLVREVVAAGEVGDIEVMYAGS